MWSCQKRTESQSRNSSSTLISSVPHVKFEEGVKIFGFPTERKYCHTVDCELALQLDHMCHYQIRAQSCRTLSNLQSFNAPCNLSLSVCCTRQNKKSKVSLTQCSTLQFIPLLCRHSHYKG